MRIRTEAKDRYCRRWFRSRRRRRRMSRRQVRKTWIGVKRIMVRIWKRRNMGFCLDLCPSVIFMGCNFCWQYISTEDNFPFSDRRKCRSRNNLFCPHVCVCECVHVFDLSDGVYCATCVRCQKLASSTPTIYEAGAHTLLYRWSKIIMRGTLKCTI